MYVHLIKSPSFICLCSGLLQFSTENWRSLPKVCSTFFFCRWCLTIILQCDMQAAEFTQCHISASLLQELCQHTNKAIQIHLWHILIVCHHNTGHAKVRFWRWISHWEPQIILSSHVLLRTHFSLFLDIQPSWLHETSNPLEFYPNMKKYSLRCCFRCIPRQAGLGSFWHFPF